MSMFDADLPDSYLENVLWGVNVSLVQHINPDFDSFLANAKSMFVNELKERKERKGTAE